MSAILFIVGCFILTLANVRSIIGGFSEDKYRSMLLSALCSFVMAIAVKYLFGF